MRSFKIMLAAAMIALAGGNIAAVQAATLDQSEEGSPAVIESAQENTVQGEVGAEQLPEELRGAYYQKKPKAIHEETGDVVLPETIPMMDFCARPAACETTVDGEN